MDNPEQGHGFRLFVGVVVILVVGIAAAALIGAMLFARAFVTEYPAAAAGVVGFFVLAYLIGWAGSRWVL